MSILHNVKMLVRKENYHRIFSSSSKKDQVQGRKRKWTASAEVAISTLVSFSRKPVCSYVDVYKGLLVCVFMSSGEQWNFSSESSRATPADEPRWHIVWIFWENRKLELSVDKKSGYVKYRTAQEEWIKLFSMDFISANTALGYIFTDNRKRSIFEEEILKLTDIGEL